MCTICYNNNSPEYFLKLIISFEQFLFAFNYFEYPVIVTQYSCNIDRYDDFGLIANRFS